MDELMFCKKIDNINPNNRNYTFLYFKISSIINLQPLIIIKVDTLSYDKKTIFIGAISNDLNFIVSGG